MGLRANKIAIAEAPGPVAPRWASTAGAPAGVSAVREMHHALERSLGSKQLDAGKWSQRRTLAFIVGTCGTFWGVVAFALFH